MAIGVSTLFSREGTACQVAIRQDRRSPFVEAEPQHIHFSRACSSSQEMQALALGMMNGQQTLEHSQGCRCGNTVPRSFPPV